MMLIAPAASGCAESDAKDVSALTVYAAASLTTVFTQLGKDFEAANTGTTVTFNFGSSSGLAQQIIAGAPADVFASASTKNMRQVLVAGDAAGPEVFANNVAQIAVAPSSRDKVRSLQDLADSRVKVALCAPAVPCGALAAKVLDAANISVKPVTHGLDVTSTLAYVTSDQVDAAIVYVTDVLAAGNKVVGVPIPVGVNASTAYEIATVTSSKRRLLAETFVRFVLSGGGQRVLVEAGFQTP